MVADTFGSSEQKFSYITLGPDEDEVIVAGVVDSQPEGNAPFGGGVAVEDAAASPVVIPAIDDVAAAPAAAKQGDAKPAADAVITPAGTEPAASAKPVKGGYQPTTLEDLERQPMPLIQKVVLAAAVIALVAFVIYQIVS